MENYFFINDVDSRTVGVKCGTFPPIVIPKKRTNSIVIDGRHGNLTETDNCYESYIWTLECYSEDKNIEQIEMFFRDAKTLRLSNNPEKVYFVRIKNQIDLSIIAEYWRNFTVVFEVQPIIKSYTIYEENVIDGNHSFTVGGTFETKPIIELEGTGNFIITINNQNIIINDLENEKIIIDTDLKIAMIDNANASLKTNVNYDNIKLNIGINNISVIGEYDSLKIKYRRCYLC